MCLERPCDCKAMKAPVGLSSRRAVCASRWKGLALTSVEAGTNTKKYIKERMAERMAEHSGAISKPFGLTKGANPIR